METNKRQYLVTLVDLTLICLFLGMLNKFFIIQVIKKCEENILSSKAIFVEMKIFKFMCYSSNTWTKANNVLIITITMMNYEANV